ncbi:MAG: PilZ domain-containing protein [Mariprofundaceae bacterium]
MAEQQNKRQDFRVEDVIPVRDEPLDEAAFEASRNRVGIRSRQSAMLQEMVGRDVFSGDFEGVNPELAKAMEMLDAKLNYLIGVNMLNDASHGDLEERPVNLSVTGASLVSPHPYQTGDHLRLHMMLPSFPPTILDLLGEVVWARRDDSGRTVFGMRFLYRCDEEEDTVARYVYRRHRETIRTRNRDKAVLEKGGGRLN